MDHPLDTVLRDPWRLLSMAVDGPLHPGGLVATDDLLDRAAVTEGTRLLDVGCGAGGSVRLAHERGAHAIGLDRSQPDTDGVRGDMTRLPFHDDSFDVVLGECVLCLSPTLGGPLRDITDVLKPGGRLALSDVTVDGPPPTLPEPIADLLCLDGQREQQRLCEHIEERGFELTDVQTHHDDLLAMRDRLQAQIDSERLQAALDDHDSQLRTGLDELNAAIESGRIGYVSIIATNQS